ncbi:MAG: UbiA family prenyltransferase [Euryarchaeota archaeon]|nr:UbiA family prenyltransferase [Euryarchaeota archaeon]
MEHLCKNWTKFLEEIFTFLSVSSLTIGATAFFVTFIGHLLLGLRPNIQICSAAFLLCFSVYSLNKLTDVDEDAINMPERTRFLVGKRRLVLYTSLGAHILSILLIFLVKPLAVPILFVPHAVNAIYGSKPIPGVPRLKDVFVVKSMSVALSWSLFTTFLSAIDMVVISWKLIALVFYFVMVKMFINTVLYDIRDVEGDKETGVRTIPVVLGAWKTTIILLALNSTLLPLLVLVDGVARLLMMVLIVYGYAYIIHFRDRRNPLLLDIFVNGEWMFTSILFISYF